LIFKFTYKDCTIALYGHSDQIQMEFVDSFQELIEFFQMEMKWQGAYDMPKIALMFIYATV